jgi:outer membrane protein assembly factor BamE
LVTGALVAALLSVMPGCVYRMPIQQGNYLDAATVAQVKQGMTRAQVRYLLGTPMVPGAFANERWDYDYYLKLGRLREPKRGHATVYFSDDKVERVDSDVQARAAVPVDTRPIHSPSP